MRVRVGARACTREAAHVSVCVGVGVYARVCVRACVSELSYTRVCMRACVRACVNMHA